MLEVPVSASVTRSSLRMISMALVTPASPAPASANRNVLPIKRAARTQRQCLGDVLTGAHTAVEHHLAAPVDGLDDFLQHGNRRRRAVQLAAAVIRDHDGIGAGGDSQSRVLGIEHAL